MNNFIWTDLSTLHVETAKSFYGDLFGWMYYDASKYHMAYAKGKEAAAILQMPDKSKKLQVASSWMPYLQVEEIDTVVLKALKLGAKIDLLPFSFNEKGKIAVIKDPSGAFLTLCEGFTMNGLSSPSDVGKFCWFELSVKEETQSIDFYSSLFDWKFEKKEKDYLISSMGQAPFATLTINKAVREENDPRWIPTFIVQQINQAKQMIVEKGGEVVSSANELITAKDVFGAVFKIKSAS